MKGIWDLISIRRDLKRLEKDLLRTKSIVDDIDDVLKYVGDDPFFEGLTAEQEDKLMNLLIGIQSLADIKITTTLNSFERVAESIDKPNTTINV